MAGPPVGPSSPVFYAALYKNLTALVQSFVKYFFTPAIYKTAFFTGTLTATVFAGMYTLPKTQGGGTYYFQIGVPGPEVGTGASFTIAAFLALAVYAVYRWRQATTQA